MGAFTPLSSSSVVNVISGGGGGSTSVTKNAAGTLVAHKLLTTDAVGDLIYADASDLTHVSKVLGVGTTSGTLGNPVVVQTYGAITNVGWAFTVGAPLYLGLTGDIVETQVGLINVPIGYAISATEIFIDIQRGIIRS